MKMRINNYKFISELNSSSKKENEKENTFRKKDLIHFDFHETTSEKNKDNECFIF